MNKVYVPQEPTSWNAELGVRVQTVDLTPALRFGQLVTCLPPNISFHIGSGAVNRLKDALKNFDEEDYLIAIGSPLAIAMSAGVALQSTGGILQLLSWDKRERQYICTRIEL